MLKRFLCDLELIEAVPTVLVVGLLAKVDDAATELPDFFIRSRWTSFKDMAYVLFLDDFVV